MKRLFKINYIITWKEEFSIHQKDEVRHISEYWYVDTLQQALDYIATSMDLQRVSIKVTSYAELPFKYL